MGLLSDIFGGSDDASQRYLQQALQAYQNVAVPTVEAGRINELPMQAVQGTVTPEDIQITDQGETDYTNISLDPTTRAAQQSALQQYIDLANAGGLDAESKLALQQIIDEANNQSRGAQGAIMNEARAMGQGGGDFALTQRAIAAQAASNNAAQQGLQTAAIADANRRAALNAMANIGGSMNAADFAQAAEKARATDAINAANVAARNAAAGQDVANKIQTGEFNVNTAQGVNAANTAAGQNKVYYNAALPQQRFNNELAKASGIAGVSGNQATAAQNAANANLGFTGSLLGTAGTIIGGAMGGPAGAAAGSQVSKVVGQNPAAGGTVTTPKNVMQYRPLGMAEGGKVPEGYAEGGVCYADGGVTHDHSICMKLGGHVPGKAEVPGDSEQNDTVPAMLSPGELVIPRSVPKTGPAMEEFARNAPVGGHNKTVDLTSFTKNYKRGK